MSEDGRLSFAARRLPRPFERREVIVAPDRERLYDRDEWRDAIVVIERGQIELEDAAGDRHRFVRGDILSLVGVPLRRLRNRGPDPAVLIAISRRLSA